MRRHVSTSLRWNLTTAALLVVVTVATVWWNIDRIDRYESGFAQATVPIVATVVASEAHRRREDVVTVTWRDQQGAPREAEYAVSDADDFPVGSTFELRSAPGSTEVYPASDNVYTPSYTGTAVLVVMALLACLPIGWLVRLFQWRRARSAPPEPVSIRVWNSRPGPISRSIVRARTVWLEVTDSHGETWFQRVMWEPWVGELKAKEYRVTGQRARKRGPMLITNTHGGRLWWAGRRRASQPMWAETLNPGPPARGGSRWSVVAILLITAVVPTLAWGWAAGAVTYVYVFAATMFYGAAPMAILTSGRGRR
jgi:hypothetical protein